MSTGFWLCSFLQTPLVMLSAHSLGLFVPGKQRANSPGYSNPFLTLCNYLEKCFDRRREKLGHFRFRRKFLEHYVKQGFGVSLFMALPPKKVHLFSCGIWIYLQFTEQPLITKCRRHKTPEGLLQNGEGRENTRTFLHEHCWQGRCRKLSLSELLSHSILPKSMGLHMLMYPFWKPCDGRHCSRKCQSP